MLHKPNDFGDTVDLQEDGILWMINRTIFHPRGFALAITEDKTDLVLLGDGQEVWNYTKEGEDGRFEKFEAMLQRRREMALKTRLAREKATND